MHIITIEIKSISEWAIIGAISVREPIFNYKVTTKCVTNKINLRVYQIVKIRGHDGKSLVKIKITLVY